MERHLQRRALESVDMAALSTELSAFASMLVEVLESNVLIPLVPQGDCARPCHLLELEHEHATVRSYSI